jgi:flagellar L-ring protein precursor FlgH
MASFMSCSERGIAWGLMLACALLQVGCIETALLEAYKPLDYEGIETPPPPVPTEGAIWNGTFPSGSFLSFDRKARNVGDLLTVLVTERASAENAASTKTESDSTLSSKLSSDVGYQALSTPISKILELLVDADTNDVPAGDELNVIDGSSTNEFDGKGGTERSGRFTAVITCRVVAVLPGDVLHVRGRRAIVVNHEMQYMTLEGLVRRADVSIENQVSSTALAEARITLDGLGVIDDKQRPGWLLRAFSWLSPL